MRTATFEVTMSDESFSAATPRPTHLAARAVGPAQKSAQVPWSATASLLHIPMLFEDGEAGLYQGHVDLMAGALVLKTLGPLAFQVPAQPISVTYRSPSGFTVTVQ